MTVKQDNDLISSFKENEEKVKSTDTKNAVRLRRAFQATKVETAINFTILIDEKITNGKISELSRSTGGIKIIWSKKLNSTAGRAHWKRERSRANCLQQGSMPDEQHFASIELAEKIIVDEDRLRNVLAHEFCHLANFMISGVKDLPHGKSFKEWWDMHFLIDNRSTTTDLNLQ